jgi:DNA ligase-1
MNDFCELYRQLDSTTRTNAKVAALKSWFATAPASDAAWAIYFLVGRRIKRLISTRLLRDWAIQQAGIAAWLFDECYGRVGDLAETIALILPEGQGHLPVCLQEVIEDHLLPLRDLPLADQKQTVLKLWNAFDCQQRFVLGKLMTGGFRVGVSRRLVIRALSEMSGIEATTIAHRLMGDWQPDADFYTDLLNPDQTEATVSRPYPFFLANPLKQDLATLGEAREWLAEWKWDGIRAQIIRRSGQTFIWSRGEDLVTGQFPEIVRDAGQLPDGAVIDGEILAWDHSRACPLPFSQLQRRLGRKRPGPRIQQKVPLVMLAFDLLEQDGHDIRAAALTERQARLGKILETLQRYAGPSTGLLFPDPVQPQASICLPPAVPGNSWECWREQWQRSKQIRAEGLMLKRRHSPYRVNRPVGDWWKWKVEPYTVDAVLVYAQRGHGRRASLYTDYTFAVWQDDQLVPFAKAYSGLTDEEIRRVDAFVRKHTRERFGPVRSVTPQLVFELAFENIQRSTRHKSGIAVRFPRINRWRHDKSPADADSLATILSMLETP